MTELALIGVQAGKPSAIPCNMTNPPVNPGIANPGFCHGERTVPAIVPRGERTQRWRANVRECSELVTGAAELDGRRVAAIHLVTG